mgnify:FL=1
MGIYLMTDASGLLYVGQSQNCARRIHQHQLRHPYWRGRVLCWCDKRSLFTFEQRAIDFYHPELNHTQRARPSAHWVTPWYM